MHIKSELALNMVDKKFIIIIIIGTLIKIFSIIKFRGSEYQFYIYMAIMLFSIGIYKDNKIFYALGTIPLGLAVYSTFRNDTEKIQIKEDQNVYMGYVQ